MAGSGVLVAVMFSISIIVISKIKNVEAPSLGQPTTVRSPLPIAACR